MTLQVLDELLQKFKDGVITYDELWAVIDASLVSRQEANQVRTLPAPVGI